jgi:hypothetical protein
MMSLIRDKAKTILNEASRRSLSRMASHMDGRSIGTISAHQGDNTPEQNNKASAELERHLKTSGLGYFKAKGQYQHSDGHTVAEKSYVVMHPQKGDDHGAVKDFLVKHGTKHGQESILHKAHDSKEAHLHFLRDSGENKKGSSFSIGPYRPNHHNPYGHTVMSTPSKVAKKGQTLAADKRYSFAQHDE